MQTRRLLAIAVFLLLQATIGCHKRVILVSPFAYPSSANRGDHLEFRKATPELPDFVVVFDGQSPCGRVTEISANGTKPGGCKVVTRASSDRVYEIYLNSPDPNIKPVIPKPIGWPIEIPFSVVPCRVCGSVITPPGSSPNAQAASGAGGGKSTSQPKVNVGTISCPSGAASVTPASASMSTDYEAIWQENGPNLGWTITKFYPSSPCKGANPTSSNPVCFLSGPAGSYKFDITVNSCASQPKGSGQLTVSP
jgi:hypothetical protein